MAAALVQARARPACQQRPRSSHPSLPGLTPSHPTPLLPSCTADAPTVLLSYLVMLAYIAVALGRFPRGSGWRDLAMHSRWG